MSEQDTPETDAAIIEADGAWTFRLKNEMQRLERERDQALDLAQDLLDALENCRVGIADSVIAKAKEVLP
jgi:hypothetical protein